MNNVDQIDKYYKLGKQEERKDRIKFAIINVKIDQIFQLAYPNWQEMDKEEQKEKRDFIADHVVDLGRVLEYLNTTVEGSRKDKRQAILEAVEDLKTNQKQGTFTLRAIENVLSSAKYSDFARTEMDILNYLNPNEVDLHIGE